MPGPGKGKSKAKKSKTPGTGSSASKAADTDAVYLTEIDNAEGWDAVVNILCMIFELPGAHPCQDLGVLFFFKVFFYLDIATRGGLKKVHTNFNVIYNRIDNAYQTNLGNYKIRGGIVGIFAKMCVDSILRNKLFEKGVLLFYVIDLCLELICPGMLEKIMPLLEIDETRHLALRALGTITHHGGAKIRMEIAKHGNVLTKLIRDLPDDEKVAELGITTLAHSVLAVVEGDNQPANAQVLKAVDMVDVLKTVLETIKRPHKNPRSMIDHAVELVAMSSLHASSAFKAYPSAIKFLVAGLRSKDWITRCTCLGGLIRLYRYEAEEDQRQLDPRLFLDALQRGVPGDLSDIMMDYGPMRCDIYITLTCTKDFQKAMMTCAQDHNLYSLGLKLAALIVKTEFSVADGMFEVEDPVTGKRSIDDMGLPFKAWGDSLPHCARAIRKHNKPGEEDLADILDIKYFIMRQRLPDAVNLAKKGIQRNPDQAYFYYASTLLADNIQGLRAAKKGLKCKTITPFVKYQMMQRAVEHAGDMGVKLLQGVPDVGEKKWEEGIAFLTSAVEDAKAYIEGAPPDNRHMKNVGYWFVLLTMLTKEELSSDLRELSVRFFPCATLFITTELEIFRMHSKD
jgi:hypothetical protein